VTLVRNARSAPEPDGVQAVRWAVDSFVLVCSERLASGAHYRVLGRWPLA
jgi:2'-5' RNA ligase